MCSRLAGLNSNIDQDKAAKKDNIDKSILGLEQTVVKHSAQEEAKFKFFKEAVAELSAKVEEEQLGRENDEESLTKEMKHFESQVS